MDSSRMRTVRGSGRILGGGVPGPGGCTWSQRGLSALGECTWSGGVYLVGGVSAPGGCTWSQRGGVPGPRGLYLVPEGVYLVPGGVPGLGGVCSGGVYLAQGVYLVPGGSASEGCLLLVSVHGQVPPPPWTDRRL